MSCIDRHLLSACAVNAQRGEFSHPKINGLANHLIKDATQLFTVLATKLTQRRVVNSAATGQPYEIDRVRYFILNEAIDRNTTKSSANSSTLQSTDGWIGGDHDHRGTPIRTLSNP